MNSIRRSSITWKLPSRRSRESIHWTATTKKFLKEALDELQEGQSTIAQKPKHSHHRSVLIPSVDSGGIQDWRFGGQQ